jgi:hypothetical protein
MTVPTADQDDVIAQLGLTEVVPTTWHAGVTLIDEIAHRNPLAMKFTRVLVTPAIAGWTLVVGPWCGMPYSLRRVYAITTACRRLSRHYGQAQAYFYGEQWDGNAWLLAERGRVRRRWISEYPELALGTPVPPERRVLDALGIAGKPEQLDPEDDEKASDDFFKQCEAPMVAGVLSVNPYDIGPATPAAGIPLLAVPPA